MNRRSSHSINSMITEHPFLEKWTTETKVIFSPLQCERVCALLSPEHRLQQPICIFLHLYINSNNPMISRLGHDMLQSQSTEVFP